jgi:hypothetical protein
MFMRVFKHFAFKRRMDIALRLKNTLNQLRVVDFARTASRYDGICCVCDRRSYRLFNFVQDVRRFSLSPELS